MLLHFSKDNVNVLQCTEILAVTFSHLFGAGAHISIRNDISEMLRFSFHCALAYSMALGSTQIERMGKALS